MQIIHSRMQTPLDADQQMQDPSHVTCDACWEANHPVDRMTDTSFAGGNDDLWKYFNVTGVLIS